VACVMAFLCVGCISMSAEKFFRWENLSIGLRCGSVCCWVGVSGSVFVVLA